MPERAWFEPISARSLDVIFETMKLAVLSLLLVVGSALHPVYQRELFPRGKSMGSGQQADHGRAGSPQTQPRDGQAPNYPKVWRSTMATRVAAQKATQERYAAQQAEMAFAARVQRSGQQMTGVHSQPSTQGGQGHASHSNQGSEAMGRGSSAGSHVEDGGGDRQ